MGSSPHAAAARALVRGGTLADEGQTGYNRRVKSAVRVASPPAKPLVIYDGQCEFCCFWIRRWEHATHDGVDYLPFQDPGLVTNFPELTRDRLETAVHFVETDGSVFNGAEAA